MFVAWLIRHFVAHPWAWYEGSPHLRVADQLERDSTLSLDERRARQWQKLQDYVRYAWDSSPFYRQRFAAIGFEPGDLKSWPDFERLPILTKDDIRLHRDQMISRSCPPKHIYPKKTSGSTGVSLNFSIDEPGSHFKRGVAHYRDLWTGWKLGEYKAAVWGNPPELPTLRQKLRHALLERAFYLDTLRMDQAMMATFADTVFEKRPTLLYGHAHSLYQFAKFWREHQYPSYSFRGAVSTAMVLHEYERNEVEEVFATKIFDRYGCEEVSLNASECEAHEGLHLNTDSMVVELIKDQTDLDEDSVVVTDLYNRAMPFIRYQVGDRAAASDHPCSCGRTYPLIERVTGRIADYLYTPEGDLVSGISLTENFATLVPGVTQFQIIQDKMDHLQIMTVPSPDYNETSSRKIAEMIGLRFGSAMRHDVQLVDSIPLEASGKYRFSICRLAPTEESGAASITEKT